MTSNALCDSYITTVPLQARVHALEEENQQLMTLLAAKDAHLAFVRAEAADEGGRGGGGGGGGRISVHRASAEYTFRGVFCLVGMRLLSSI